MSDTLVVFAYAMIALAALTSAVALAAIVDLVRSARTDAVPAASLPCAVEPELPCAA